MYGELGKQAEANSGNYQPILVIKKNNVKPLVVVDAETFVTLIMENFDERIDDTDGSV